jgi:hypothetical protein
MPDIMEAVIKSVSDEIGVDPISVMLNMELYLIMAIEEMHLSGFIKTADKTSHLEGLERMIKQAQVEHDNEAKQTETK